MNRNWILFLLTTFLIVLVAIAVWSQQLQLQQQSELKHLKEQTNEVADIAQQILEQRNEALAELDAARLSNETLRTQIADLQKVTPVASITPEPVDQITLYEFERELKNAEIKTEFTGIQEFEKQYKIKISIPPLKEKYIVAEPFAPDSRKSRNLFSTSECQVKVQISAYNFAIPTNGSVIQPIKTSSNMDWEWDIKPTKEGEQMIVLYFYLITPSGETLIKSIDLKIDVTSTTGDKIIRFIKTNWGLLFSAIVMPVVGLLANLVKKEGGKISTRTIYSKKRTAKNRRS